MPYLKLPQKRAGKGELSRGVCLSQSLGIAIGVDAAVGFLALLFFELLRNSKFGNHFYEPKIFTTHGNSKRPPALPSGIFRWISPTLSASQQAISSVAGADGAMYIMLLRFGESAWRRLAPSFFND